MDRFETIGLRIDEHVAHVTLDRPDVMNAFDGRMLEELRTVWRSLREDDAVRCVVLDASGDAFCTGVDRDAALGEDADMAIGEVGGPFHFDDPGAWLGPKANDLWKPVVAAVQGIACGGAFYLLGEVDVIIASEDATFFDPHVTYGMAAVFESVHMAQRMPLGEVLRMQLMGAHERMSAERAHQIGFVSEVVARDDLAEAAGRVARTIASQPPLAVQGTLRSVWTAAELSRSQALDAAIPLISAGNSEEALAMGQQRFERGERVEWRLR
ncbi:MAG: enoyl-CoA hydratase/isomerase family protein [Actinobacteria bacterium]|nr:enoyl-CoA hydratase/isomerase family protein [Actinomycetota bacterium]